MQRPVTTNKIKTADIVSFLNGQESGPIEGLHRRPKLGLHRHVPGFESKCAGTFIVLSDAETEDGNIRLQNIGNANEGPILILENCTATRIHLNNCHFKALHFYNSNIKLISLETSTCEEIKLKNTVCDYVKANNSLLGTFQLQKNTQTHAMEFGGCIIDELYLEDESTCVKLKIHSFSSCGKLSLLDKSNCIEIHWSESHGKEMTVEGGRVNYLVFVKGTMLDILHLRMGSEIGNLLILQSSCWDTTMDDCRITRCIIVDAFQNLRINNTSMNDVRFTSCRFHLVDWESGNRGDFIFRNCDINTFRLFKATLPREAVCTIIDSRLFYVLITDTIILGQLALRNVTPREKPFLLENDSHKTSPPPDTQKEFREKFIQKLDESKVSREKWYNNHLIYVEDCPSPNSEPNDLCPVLRIVNSSMGKSEITGTNLASFKVQFSKSRMLDLYMNGTDFTQGNIEICGTGQKTREAKEQRYFFYSQVKKIYESQGDLIAATKYHSLAMKYQEEVLEDIYKENAEGKTGWRRIHDWLELKTFRLNNLSNRHGESWPQALLFTVLLSTAMYVIYCLTLYSETKTFGTAHLVGEYFSFLDPTHKQDFLLPKTQLNAWAKFVDFLGRIIITYSIFQLVAAFRRHGRRAQ